MTGADTEQPLLIAEGLSKSYGRQLGCRNVSFSLYEGEVMAVVGESGSGKTTLLQLLSAQLAAGAGRVLYRMRDGVTRDLAALTEAERRFLFRTDWGYVYQDAAQGLRMAVSGGANVGERLMATGWRHYGRIRHSAATWLDRVEIDGSRIDDTPQTYSGGMRQRLQIARNLVTNPRLVFMDEPTGGLDVSVQARLLDLLRGLVTDLGLSAVVVTHDLAVARLLSHRIMVMKGGEVDRDRAHRSGARRSARELHAASRVLDFADMRRPMSAALELSGVGKSFTMHLQGGVRLPVVSDVAFTVRPGECVVLAGPSGSGKSSILKMIFGSYRCDAGRILVRRTDAVIDVARAEPRAIIALRRRVLGYVTQFLRAVPRVAAVDIVADPLVGAGEARDAARRRAVRDAPAPEHPRAALGAAAGDVLRRRAAARQHRARISGRPADPAAGRADRVARRGEPDGGGRSHRRAQAARNRNRRHRPRRGGPRRRRGHGRRRPALRGGSLRTTPWNPTNES